MVIVFHALYTRRAVVDYYSKPIIIRRIAVHSVQLGVYLPSL